jgi:outer membrane protein insertion porin family
VQAETRFLEEPGKVDLIYNVEEGKRYRVGKINVKVEGEHPHTRQQAVLNRISLRPGDIIDIRQVRASERRLKASGLFLNDPAQGSAPKLVIVPPKLDEDSESVAERPNRDRVRGQSPDGWGPRDVIVDVGVEGQLPNERPAPPQPFNAQPRTRQNAAKPPIVRGQNPEYRPERTAPVVRGQYNGPFGGQQVGPMGPPSNYQYAPRAAQPSQAVGDDVFAPTQLQPGVAPAAPAQQPYVPPQPSAPPQQYAPPGGFGQPGTPPNTLPPPPSQPAPLFGNIFGNQGPAPVDENGFVPPSLEDPDGYVDIDSIVQETQTGRFMFGVGVNSDAGVVGSIVIDEQNFDWRRWPVNGWEDFRNGTAFRGAGQRFRVEAAPGTQVQRYMINFTEPYLFDTPVSLGLSGFYYTRLYTDWTEQRLGAKVNLGYQFTPDLSGTVGFGGQEVNISNPRQPTPQDLAEVLGDTSLYTVSTQIQHDTRDNTFMPTEGHLVQFGYDQNFGDFVFPRFTANLRQFFPLRERPDGSGRHVLSLIGQVGWSGSDTPIYERFFIGGFSTLRGFRFRGVGPTDMDVKVGGNFELLTSAEYMFPITADDMLRGVVFADAGTIEPTAQIDDYRVAPGFGMRITVPALGPAPIALDFAFPVAFESSDQRQVFSFFVGFGR